MNNKHRGQMSIGVMVGLLVSVVVLVAVLIPTVMSVTSSVSWSNNQNTAMYETVTNETNSSTVSGSYYNFDVADPYLLSGSTPVCYNSSSGAELTESIADHDTINITGGIGAVEVKCTYTRTDEYNYTQAEDLGQLLPLLLAVGGLLLVAGFMMKRD